MDCQTLLPSLVHQFEGESFDGESFDGESFEGKAGGRAMTAVLADRQGVLPALTTEDLREVLRRLPSLDTGVDDSERIDQIALLESIKAAAAGAQARVSAAFADSQRESQAASGLPARERGKGIAAQIALARRDSPARGSRHLGFARAMVHELPHTMAHLEAGRVSEWRATIICRETACLSPEDRAEVDAALAPDLPRLGDRQVEARARALACTMDAAAMATRAARAHSERRVSLRPAPDTMTHLTALLPVAQGVAVFAALEQAAGSARAEGDERGRGQVMADTLVERVTGQTAAAAVPIEVQLVMPAEAGSEPALLGGQVLPAQTARDLVSSARQEGARLTLRRVLTTDDGVDLAGISPRSEPFTTAGHVDRHGTPADRTEVGTEVGTQVGTQVGTDLATGTPPGPPEPPVPAEPPGHLEPPAATEPPGATEPPVPGGADVASSGRRFTGAVRRFILLRDQTCRTPWCDAPIRHVDHAIAVRDGGPTTAANGQGLCEGCNYAKEAPGWRARTVRAGPGHTVRTTTPTGHTYDSTAPPLLPARVRAGPVVSAMESHYAALLLSA